MLKIRNPQKYWEFKAFLSKIFSKWTKNHKGFIFSIF